MKPTIHQVAAQAGVSIGTVSRVMRGYRNVTSEKVIRVRAAAEALDYHPLRHHPKAESGHALKDKNIALVLLGMDRSLTALPVVAAAIQGVEAAVAAAGGSLLLADVPHLDRLPPVLQQNRIAGAILKGALQGNAIATTQNDLTHYLRDLPCVWVLGRPEGCWGDSVAPHDGLIGKLAAEHLVARGHRHLAFINPKADHHLNLRRGLGFQHRAASLGATVHCFVGRHPERWEVPVRPVADATSIQELVDEILAATPRPTAVFAPADSIAGMVYRALQTRGLQAGRDLGVISCNNERPITASLFPALTTMECHAEAAGHRAVDALSWRLQHPDAPTSEILLEPTLVPGDSSILLPA